VVTSTEWWDELKPGVRDQFSQILKEVTEERNSEAVQVNLANKQKIVEAGGTIRTLTPEQRSAWIKAMRPVWSKFEKDIGSDLIESAQKGT
jgi:C4-dicarboxylate-binding protein DctP